MPRTEAYDLTQLSAIRQMLADGELPDAAAGLHRSGAGALQRHGDRTEPERIGGGQPQQ